MATQDVNHIAVNTDISTEMYDLLKQQFKDKDNIQKFQSAISSVKKIIQEQAVILAEARMVDTATGPLLDEIGLFLGVPRKTDDDEAYRQTLKVRINRVRTHGTRDEIINIISSATGIPATELITYVGLYKSVDVAIVLTCLNYETGVDEITKMIPVNTNFRLINRPPSPAFCYSSVFATSDPVGCAGYGTVQTTPSTTQTAGYMPSLISHKL